ncbi:hypothetical protein BH11ACT2_BH11ACT2_13680 [soil metagenome]
MISWTIAGLPLHPLIVHFVAVAVPLSVLCIVLTAAWPAARRRLGIVTPIIALAALVAVPLATQAGEALERQVDRSAAVQAHTRIGDTLLPWAAAVFLVALVQWAWYRFGPERVTARTARVVITVVLAVAVAASAVGAIITVVRIGDSGARAVWTSGG